MKEILKVIAILGLISLVTSKCNDLIGEHITKEMCCSADKKIDSDHICSFASWKEGKGSRTDLHGCLMDKVDNPTFSKLSIPEYLTTKRITEGQKDCNLKEETTLRNLAVPCTECNEGDYIGCNRYKKYPDLCWEYDFKGYDNYTQMNACIEIYYDDDTPFPRLDEQVIEGVYQRANELIIDSIEYKVHPCSANWIQFSLLSIYVLILLIIL